MYKPMNILTAYSRWVDVFLYILQNMISIFEKMLLCFYVHCGFGIGLILVNTGLLWELHGPHTAFIQSTFWLVPTRQGSKCGKRVVPTLSTGHSLDQDSLTDGPARKPFIKSFKFITIHLIFIKDIGLATFESMFQERNQLQYVIL